MSIDSVQLGDIASFIRGITFKPGDVVAPGTPGAIQCMRTKNVQANLDLSDVWAVDERFVKRPEQILEAGDLLISSANSWNLVGKCSWIPELDAPSTFGGFVTALRGDSEVVDRRYLYHWFSRRDTQAAMRSFSRQTTNIANLDIKRCLELSFPLPPLPEQKRIAAVLDQVDTLRAKRREAITLLDNLTQSVFLSMFEGVGEGWIDTTVGDLAAPGESSIRTGPFGSQLLHEEFTESGIPVLGIDNAVQNKFQWGKRRYISEEKYLQLSRYTVHPGDLLITIMGTCGRCAVVPQDIPKSINTKHLCCITLDQKNCLPEFLHAYFLMHVDSQDYLTKNTKGAVMGGLNMGLIKTLPVRLPPMEIQRSYVMRVRAVSALQDHHRTHLAVLDELFASLQQRAFSGTLWDHGGEADVA
ncbi:restriction endonuclease subunit S [Streptomyces sp. W16]|uniref:restriction endonuclease subunit S n=1 Tax=Streptomyces sp. W16 TaxID=3076631 RepID=UPI00295C01E9|nr:restriction endonuclease subunit S [Streptomyces sp. W16]MDV9169461.1 restriction endonuclease subunit S [Streptomyces sp. W16]